VWAVLVGLGVAEDALSQEDPAGYLIAQLDEWKAADAPDQGLPAEGDRTAEIGQAGSARQWALSVLLAEDAAQDEEVESFRADVLGGDLLAVDQVQEWIATRREQDGHPTRFVEVARPSDAVENLALRAHTLLFPGQYLPVTNDRFSFLAFPDRTGEGAWVARVPVAAGGVLDRLRALSEALTGDYGWQPAQATAFVLSGAIPIVPFLTVTVRLTAPAFKSRVVLTIDPEVPPSAVEAAYRSARRQLVGPRVKIRTTHVYQAVAFAAARERLTWPQRAKAWSTEHPEHPYGADAFRRVVERATRGLLRE
jgi:hypothetical protein